MRSRWYGLRFWVFSKERDGPPGGTLSDGRTDAIEGVAAGASARVGEILAEAERHGRECHAEAERAAAEAERDARADAERLFDDARAEARRVARERADHLAAIQAKLAARGPAVLEGLEGAGATRARIEALIEALSAAADRVLAEAEAGEPEAAAAPASAEASDIEVAAEEASSTEPDLVETESLPEESRNPAEEAVSDAVVVDEPVDESAEDAEDGSQNGDGDTPVRYDGPLPEGAPMVRKPRRTPERDARFAALLLALQGRDRDDVEEHLRSEHELGDCRPILDEVFGRA